MYQMVPLINQENIRAPDPERNIRKEWEKESEKNISDVALDHRANEIANNPTIDEPQRRDAKLVIIE